MVVGLVFLAVMRSRLVIEVWGFWAVMRSRRVMVAAMNIVERGYCCKAFDSGACPLQFPIQEIPVMVIAVIRY